VDAFIGNAAAWRRLQDPVGMIWSFVHGKQVVNRWRTMDQVPARTDASATMSRTLRAAGFRFVGPTICYALMQSAGLVNDHLLDCFRHPDFGA
jgi:DNA-3-methyladenine glycosylase I